jgi:hypothetical protein
MREDLKKLRHDRSVRDYVKKFSSWILDIDNVSKENKLFNFLSRLQLQAQLELRRKKIEDSRLVFGHHCCRWTGRV